MKRFILLIFSILFATISFAQENPVTWSQSVQKLDTALYRITFEALVPAPWHMYDARDYGTMGPTPTSLNFNSLEGFHLVGELEMLDEPTRVFDEIFEMEIGYFTGRARFAQNIALTASTATLSGYVEWMACDEQRCLPPAEWEFEIALEGASNTQIISQQSADAPLETGRFWSGILQAILWGFAALLTPCVFPMVPMTISFFMKGSENKVRARARGTIFGLSIIALYTLPIFAIILITNLIGGESVTADIFNWLATHWIPNVIFFLVFMIFAASFFGAFEITLPAWMANKSDANADRKGLAGIFFMALTLVLVSFSCTGPIVGSVLISSTQGDVWQPVFTMLAFSAAFALPFTLFALFPSLLRGLPKSGGWLGSVKVVLGFLEVALGLKFLSVADQTYHWGLLDREIYLAIWIVVFTLLGMYLLGKLRFAHDSEVKHISVTRLFLSIVVLSFVVYLVPGMFGAPLKGISGYLPPLSSQDFVLGASVNQQNKPVSQVKYGGVLHLPHALQGYFDYEEGMAHAREVGKPVFLDFTGHGCVNCREMEARVWSDPQVLEILRDSYVVISLYSDDKMVVPENDWVTTESGRVLKSLGKINSHFARTRFNANAQPLYLLLDNAGELLAPPRGYDLDTEEYIAFLKRGLEAYENQ